MITTGYRNYLTAGTQSRKCVSRWRLRFYAAAVALVLVAGAYRTMAQDAMQTEESVKTLTTKANAGDAAAQFNLGFMYANGQVVPRDYGQAAVWYR
jgi:TPR repeat protein